MKIYFILLGLLALVMAKPQVPPPSSPQPAPVPPPSQPPAPPADPPAPPADPPAPPADPPVPPAEPPAEPPVPPSPPPAPVPPPDEPAPAPPPSSPAPVPQPPAPTDPAPAPPAPNPTGAPPPPIEGPICECGYTYCAEVLMGMEKPWNEAQLSQAYCKTPNANCPQGSPATSVDSALYICLCDQIDQKVGDHLELLCGCDTCLNVGPDFRGRCKTPCLPGRSGGSGAGDPNTKEGDKGESPMRGSGRLGRFHM